MTDADPRKQPPLALFVLTQEETLTDLHDAIVALDLIAGGNQGVEADDMVGLKVLTRLARARAETVRQAWRDTCTNQSLSFIPCDSPSLKGLCCHRRD